MGRLLSTQIRFRLLIHLGLSLCVVVSPVLSSSLPRAGCGDAAGGVGSDRSACCCRRPSGEAVQPACCTARQPSPGAQRISERTCCAGAAAAAGGGADMAPPAAVRPDSGHRAAVGAELAPAWRGSDRQLLIVTASRGSTAVGCPSIDCRCGHAPLGAWQLSVPSRTAAERLVTTLAWCWLSATSEPRGWPAVLAASLSPWASPKSGPPIYSWGHLNALICCWIC